MKYLTLLSYDGKDFYGWAKQPNLRTVQSELEKLSKYIFGSKAIINASGRTDRYVHALEIPVVFETKVELSISKFKDLFNKNKPSDINLSLVKIIDDKFSPRFNAKGKTYKYLINLKGYGDTNYYYNYRYSNFDLNKLIETSKIFIGKKNFASFTGKQDYEDYVREVTDINISVIDDILTIKITGNGFLRYMVRNIVGSLLAHNRGKVTTEEILDWINNPIRGKSHYKVPGAGLYLEKVYY